MKIVLTGDLAETLREEAVDALAGSGVEPELVLLRADGRFDGDPAGCEVVHFCVSAARYEPAMRSLILI